MVNQITPGGSALAVQQVYFAIGAAIIVLLVAATTLATASIVRGTPWLAAHVALSPVLVTAALVSFDMLGVALATFGLACWARRRPVAAGVLLGAAVMARTYPLVIIAAIVLIAVRDKQLRPMARMLGGAAAAVAVCCALAVLMGGNPLDPYRTWWDQKGSYGAPSYVLTIAHVSVPGDALSIIAVLGWVIAILLGLYLTGRPKERTQLAPLALTMLVVVLLTGKSMSVQTCLWLLPLLAVSAIRWRDHLVWAGVEITYFVMVWLYIAGPSNPGKAMPGAAFSFFLIVRAIAYVGIAWASWESSEDLPRDPLDPYAEPRPAPAAGRRFPHPVT
nr:glycosyltransferase 87 family protein [Flexivirga aerilata]